MNIKTTQTFFENNILKKSVVKGPWTHLLPQEQQITINTKQSIKKRQDVEYLFLCLEKVFCKYVCMSCLFLYCKASISEEGFPGKEFGWATEWMTAGRAEPLPWGKNRSMYYQVLCFNFFLISFFFKIDTEHSPSVYSLSIAA